MGHTAYQLELPATSEIHNVFHVSQFKLCPNLVPSVITPLLVVADMFDEKGELEAILEGKMVKRSRVTATKVLVKWKNLPEELTTLEFYYDLLQKHPNFHP